MLINVTTGDLLEYSLILFLTSYRAMLSYSLLNCKFWSRGYLYSGICAHGQSKAGISSLCMALDLVADKDPNILPWNPDLKLRTESYGDPGD